MRTAPASKTTAGQGKGFTATSTRAGRSPAPRERPRIALPHVSTTLVIYSFLGMPALGTVAAQDNMQGRGAAEVNGEAERA